MTFVETLVTFNGSQYFVTLNHYGYAQGIPYYYDLNQSEVHLPLVF